MTGASRRIAVFAIAAAGYLLAAIAGYALALQPVSIVVLWPASGFLLALLICIERKLWPVVLAGAVLGNLTADLTHGLALRTAVTGAAANALESVVAAWVTVWLAGPRMTLGRLRDVLALVVGAAVVANALTALAGAVAITTGSGSSFGRAWFVWWSGDGMGMLIVAPALIAWADLARRRPALRRGAVAEATLVFALLTAVAIVVLGQAHTTTGGAGLSHPYLIFPLLFWAAFRLGPIGASTATLLLSFVTVWYAAHGTGAFAQPAEAALDEALEIYGYLGLASLSTLLPAAVLREWAVAEANAIGQARQSACVAEVAASLTEGKTLAETLQVCAGALCRHLGVAHTRIWIADDREPVLRLEASAGRYGDLDRRFARIVIGGNHKIARVAATRQPYVAHRVQGEAESGDQNGASAERLMNLAAYPLVVEPQLVGVVAVYGREPLPSQTLQTLESAARTLALAIADKQAEWARAQLAEILEAASDFVTIGQPEGPPRYINPAARAALGIGPTEAVRTLFDFRPEGYESFFRNVFLPALERDGIWHGETEYRARRGRAIPVSQISVAHKDQDGHIAFISTISRDISGKKAADDASRRMADALRETTERMQFALAASQLGVWDANLKTGVSYWSEICEAMHGLEPGTFSQSMKAFLECVHPDDRQRVNQAIDHAIREHTDVELEYRTVWPDGTVRRINSTGRFTYDTDGAPHRAAGVVRDVTERKQLEEQIGQSRKLEAMGQLAGGLAHDFNNLLTVILGFGHQLEEQLSDIDPRRGDVAEILGAAERASTLTRQLLTFGRRQVLSPVVLNLADVIGELSGILRRVVGEHIELVLDLDPCASWVKADRSQIEQVVVNLASNARDAMPGGGKVTIATTSAMVEPPFAHQLRVPPGRYVLLAVTDRGIGMDEATRARIFEPFFTTKSPGKGTGLGLSSVLGIVQQGGGGIWVYSRPGQGSSFRVYLPEAGEAADEELRLSQPDRIQGGSEVILLVEDERAVGSLVRSVLERYGYTVLFAPGPDEALDLIRTRSGRIDLLLTDVVMPGRQGPELFAQVRASNPSLRVLYMSGFAADAVLNKTILDARMPFLPKPFTAPALARRVREVLDAVPAS